MIRVNPVPADLHDVGRLATFLGRLPDTATADDLRRVRQQDTAFPILSVLRFFFTKLARPPSLVRKFVRLAHPHNLPGVLMPLRWRTHDRDRGVRTAEAAARIAGCQDIGPRELSMNRHGMFRRSAADTQPRAADLRMFMVIVDATKAATLLTPRLKCRVAKRRSGPCGLILALPGDRPAVPDTSRNRNPKPFAV